LGKGLVKANEIIKGGKEIKGCIGLYPPGLDPETSMFAAI